MPHAVREPTGEAGRAWRQVNRGQRPAPLSADPSIYTPAGWSDECDRTLTDPKFSAGAEVRRGTWLSADVRAVAPQGDESSAMAESVELVNAVFGWDGAIGMLERGWPQVASELAVVADLKGCSLGEERFEMVGGLLVPVDIEQRHSALIDSWVRDERGRVTGVTMKHADLRRMGQLYTIPLYDAADIAGGGGVHITFDMFGDPEGRLSAVLGPVREWRVLKERMSKAAADGVARWAMPVVNAVLQTAAAQALGLSLDDPTVVQAVAAARESAVAYLGGEDAALFSSDLVGFEEFGGSLDLSQWVALSNEVDQQGLTSLGVPTLMMGVSAKHGSHSASEVIDDLLVRSVAARATMFLAQFRRQTVARVVRFNLGPGAPLPMLEHEGLDADGLAGNLGVLASLAAARLLYVDDGVRRRIRRTVGLPAETSRSRPAQPNDMLGPYFPTGEDVAAGVAIDEPGQRDALEQYADPGSPGPGRGNEGPMLEQTDGR